jgi:hypothetical protein
MNCVRPAIIFLFLLILAGCITSYTPGKIEDEQALVVEGLITDQPGVYTVEIALSTPLWSNGIKVALTGCTVWITDDNNGRFDLTEGVKFGTYLTDPATFRGEAGRVYTLHIITNDRLGNLYYESYPTKMIAVPPVDSIYYEKRTYNQAGFGTVEGCQIFLNTHDPAGECRFYRWEYNETWEFSLPSDYMVLNKTCWRSENSSRVLIKSSSSLENEKISRFPLLAISNPVDRLSVKYSLLVNQFSLNEDEFYYWDKIKNMTEETGGLYDVIPASISSNVYCPDNITRKVLGYFSVSAVKSKRIFIKDNFIENNMIYYNCIADTVHKSGNYWVKFNYISHKNDTILGEGISYWVLLDFPGSVPPTRMITWNKDCADCTTRGTNIKPDFWNDDK